MTVLTEIWLYNVPEAIVKKKLAVTFLHVTHRLDMGNNHHVKIHPNQTINSKVIVQKKV